MPKNLDFNLAVDGAPFVVRAEAYKFNDELQYNVSINGGPNVLFSFDSELGRYAARGDEAIDVPDNVEMEIGNRLNGKSLNELMH
jgi:hypothetical protein